MHCLSLTKNYLKAARHALNGRAPLSARDNKHKKQGRVTYVSLGIVSKAGPRQRCATRTRATYMQVLVMTCGLFSFTANDHALAAQEPPPRPLLSEEDYLGEMPMVLSATRLAQPLSETPVAMTIIDRQMIEASGARAIADLFRLVPGMVVGYDNGNRPVVSIHGMTDVFSRRMQVLIDGRSVYIPTYGGVPWSDLGLALEDIERIEVVRGPNAATYGANSFLGIISIITRGARDDLGTQVKLNAGTHSIRDGVVRTSDSIGDLDYRVIFGYQQDDGFEERYDRQQHKYVTTALDYHLGTAGDIETRLGYDGGVNEKGTLGSSGNGTRDQGTISRFEQVRWRRDLGESDNISLQLYHNYHESDEQYTTLPLAIPIAPFSLRIPINNDVTGERYDLELQNTIGINRNLRSVWGLGWRIDKVVAPGYLGTAAALDNRIRRVFVNVEWRATPSLLLNAGSMWENDDISGSDTSPRIALNYQLTSHQTLRASISRATRNPVLVEEVGNSRICVDSACTVYDQVILSSGGLKPERMLSREIGYFASVGGNISLDIRVYHDKLSGLIEGYDRPYAADLINSKVGDFRNGDNAVIKGIETQLSYRPSFKDRVLLGYAYTRIKSDNADYVNSAPRDSGSLLVIHALPKDYQASLGFYYVGTMAFLDANRAKPVRRLDLRLARPYVTRKTEGNIALVFQNLLDDYNEYYPTSKRKNAFDTRVYLSFSLNFKQPRQP